MHLEAHRSRSGLAFALAGSSFSQVGEIFFAYAFERQVFFEIFGAASVYMDFEVHLGFSMQSFEIALKLALVGAN